MFILIKNTVFGYNKFLVDSLYISNTIEEAREKAFKIIKQEYMEEYGDNEPDIIKYDGYEAEITYDYEEAYTTKQKSPVFVTISKPTTN